MSFTLNDVHSQLNPTAVVEVVRPQNLAELVQIIRDSRDQGLKISVAGGRHAMGGQQFASGSRHIDMTGLDQILDVNTTDGLLHIEAGADWPKIIAATHRMQAGSNMLWAIRQKQTGVDAVTLGGSISANAHGRGLLMQPLSDDIENLSVLDADGEILFCSRTENPALFALVIGGYGLFGIIYSATLRLTPRRCVERMVDIIDLDDAMNAVFRRINDGCLYGDFQFVIDPHDSGFLRRGVFACYKPVGLDEAPTETSADLTPDRWLKLLQLAHDDKSQAFRLYAQHYLGTDGNRYWSDTMQLSTYIPSYADFLDNSRLTDSGGGLKETLVIGEHYVPRDQLLRFIHSAREIFKRFDTEVIYGTIRAILRDRVSFLPWASEDFVCIVFNLRTPHTVDGRERTAATFRALIDAGILSGGSFFLTYHRYASASQIESCYPQFREWLALKKQHDPSELFISDWYLHYRDEFQAHLANP